MVKICEGDLLSSGAQFICHQVNCQGEMRSGVAKQIREKWPEIYNHYKAICDSVDNKFDLLGRVIYATTTDNNVVVSMFCQTEYGYDGKQYTYSDTLKECLHYLSHIHGGRIAMPYKIGCGLGGADWNVVYKMIEEAFKDREVELWKLA